MARQLLTVPTPFIAYFAGCMEGTFYTVLREVMRIELVFAKARQRVFHSTSSHIDIPRRSSCISANPPKMLVLRLEDVSSLRETMQSWKLPELRRGLGR